GRAARAPGGLGDGAQDAVADDLRGGRRAGDERELQLAALGAAERDDAAHGGHGPALERLDRPIAVPQREERDAGERRRRGAGGRRAEPGGLPDRGVRGVEPLEREREPIRLATLRRLAHRIEVREERGADLAGGALEAAPRLLDGGQPGVLGLAAAQLADELRARAAV